MSKAGIEMFTKFLAHDLARYNIRVNAISPGLVPTNLQTAAGLFDSTDAYRDRLLSASATHPLGRVGEPGEVTRAILFLLGDSAGWITGTTLNVDGGSRCLSGRGEVLDDLSGRRLVDPAYLHEPPARLVGTTAGEA